MALQVAAVLAVIAAVQQFAQIPMITRLLEHWSHESLNKIDDDLVDALCNVPETEIPAVVAKQQAKYDAMPSDEKLAAKASLVPLIAP